MTADRTPTSEGPRTEAGRALLDLLHPLHAMSRRNMLAGILAIESEAAASPEERGGGADARETLAALEHDQWIEWSRTITETEDISPERVERWSRYWVPYADLDEPTKDHDRRWADKVLAIVSPASPLNPERVVGTIRVMASVGSDYDARIDSGDLGSTPLIRPSELASEFVEAYAATPAAPSEPAPLDVERLADDDLALIRASVAREQQRRYAARLQSTPTPTGEPT